MLNIYIYIYIYIIHTHASFLVVSLTPMARGVFIWNAESRHQPAICASACGCLLRGRRWAELGAGGGQAASLAPLAAHCSQGLGAAQGCPEAFASGAAAERGEGKPSSRERDVRFAHHGILPARLPFAIPSASVKGLVKPAVTRS